MRSTRYLFITLFLSCMAVCLLAPRLRAGGTCSDTTATSTDDATHEEILSEFDPSQQILLDGNFYLGDVPSQIDPNLPQSGKKGPGAIGDLPDTFNSTKKPPKLVDGKPSKYSDEHGDWYWGTDGHLYPWPPPPTQPETDDGTAPEADSVVDDFQPSVSAIAASGDITADEAFGKFQKAVDEAHFWWLYSRITAGEAARAAEESNEAINDVMDAEPGVKAKRAAERAKKAAKKAEETAQEAEKARKEYKKAEAEAKKAHKEYEEAVERATQEAEKQNEAARDAAEKAYEATGHGTSNKK